jgi:hypothetical protein
MRKVDPAGVRADFEASTQDIVDFFDRTCVALSGTPTKESDISRLATTSFLALFVVFERFLSDLFLAYLNRDFSVYQARLADRLSNSVEDKFGQAVERLVSLKTRAHMSVDEIESIVDPDGWNLTFSSVDNLKTRADEWLGNVYATRVKSITAGEARLIETARAVRNFIAHQSSGSKSRMNDALATIEIGGHNRHLARGLREVHAVGSYLKATHAGLRRFHRYGMGLRAIAAHV